MKVKELINVIFDKVIIYKGDCEEYEDLYEGNVNDIPLDILDMKVRNIGAKKKEVLDIQVF